MTKTFEYFTSVVVKVKKERLIFDKTDEKLIRWFNYSSLSNLEYFIHDDNRYVEIVIHRAKDLTENDLNTLYVLFGTNVQGKVVHDGMIHYHY